MLCLQPMHSATSVQTLVVCVRIYTYAHAYTHTHLHTHAHIYTHMHTHIHTHAHTPTHTHAHMYTKQYTNIYNNTQHNIQTDRTITQQLNNINIHTKIYKQIPNMQKYDTSMNTNTQRALSKHVSKVVLIGALNPLF